MKTNVGTGTDAKDGAGTSAVARHGVVNPKPLTSRGLRTRNAVIEASREEFEAMGLAEARVAEITTKARVSYGTFYTYFESKEAVFHEVVDAVVEDMFAGSTVESPRDGAVARIEAANRYYLQAFERNAGIMRVMEEAAPYDAHTREQLHAVRLRFERRIEEGLRRQEQQGLAKSGVGPELASQILGGMVEQFGRNVFLHGRPYDEDRAVEALTRLWVQAICLKV